MARFRLAVLADSHFHPPGVPEQAAWEADRWFNDRNRAAVALVRAAEPAWVIHLGDVPHPVPGLTAHRAALDVARETYAGLPLAVVPGNHDIGDKPHKLSPVPRRHDEVLTDFVARWGPPHQRIDHEGWAFLLINTPVLNSGHPWEVEQWAWLEAQVAALQGGRWMAFLHYPPYLCRPDEPEHYDNLGQPARGRLLELLAAARMVFCGHVHHPFWHPRGAQDLWICPSTAFVRPGYSELARIEPSAAFGRDDVDKLGFFVVHVDGDSVELELVRTQHAGEGPLAPGQGAPPACPLGFTVRHPWEEVLEIPADGLDPFQRKAARNDLVLLALMELGARQLRLPVADLDAPERRARLQALIDRGWSFTFYGTDPPRPDPLAARWEVLNGAPGPGHWVSVVRRSAVRDGERFSHFPSVGYDPSEPLPEGAVVRVPAEVWPLDAAPGGAMALIELPRLSESARMVDDAWVAARACEALLAAQGPRAVFLDGFVDHDRGYFPRNGLIDRRFGPRPAHRCLVNLNRLLPRPWRLTADHRPGGPRVWRVEGRGELWLPWPGAEVPAGLDLAQGRFAPAGFSPWPRWVELAAPAEPLA